MLISPLAAKICKARGIDPATLRGSGPRGRIMSADVLAPAPARRRGETVMSSFSTPPTRPAKDGFYIYDGTVDMSALAAISLPVAVQCEKLLENRYSLFDYITRATVKACLPSSAWEGRGGRVDVLLFENKGEKIVAIQDAAAKTLYRFVKEAQSLKNEVPEDFRPGIVVCDSQTHREQVAAYLGAARLPLFAFVARGNSPKDGIRAGAGLEGMSHRDLHYTFYADASLPQKECDSAAAYLQALLLDPVRLLLLS